MLRQALEGQQQQQQQQQKQQQQPHSHGLQQASEHDIVGPSESTSLDHSTTDTTLLSRGYGATSEAEDNNSHLPSYEDEEDYLLDDDDDDDDDSQEDDDDDDYDLYHAARRNVYKRLWTSVRNGLMVIANVENLWDTPPQEMAMANREQHHRSRNNFVVLFWFVTLATAYASERSTFKLCVDRAGPFRLFAVEMVTASHALMLIIGMFLTKCFGEKQRLPLGLPLVDVGLMALLDTAVLMLVFLTGVHVPPTLTVILVQFTLPLTALLTQAVHPDGRCSCVRPVESAEERGGQRGQCQTSPDTNTSFTRGEGAPLPGWGGLSPPHLWGSLIISIAVLLALFPAVYTIVNPDFFIYADTIPIRTAINTLLFVSSCIPAAASQLYKEHIFLQYKQPVNMYTLNLLLSIFQLVFSSIMAPLVFGLQGLGARGDWTELYPSVEFGENYLDGLRCFFRLLSDDDQENKYPEEARCDFTLGLVLVHSFSVIAVGAAVDKIINAGATKVMYRGISAGIILAVLCMHAYDMNIPEFNYGPVIDGLNLICLLLLILGSEVYHRVSLFESTFETVYPEIQTYYDDE